MASSFDIYPHSPLDILMILGMVYKHKLFPVLFLYRVTRKTALTIFSINCFVKNQSSSQINVPNQTSLRMHLHSVGSVKQRGSQI